MEKKPFDARQIVSVSSIMVVLTLILILLVTVMTASLFFMPALETWYSGKNSSGHKITEQNTATSLWWKAPDESTLSTHSDRDEILYGKALIENTSEYLGPKGRIKSMSNGMNCQNCHLNAGTKIYGNNYSAVSSTYPKFRARSGTDETIEKRINDCFERSLNGSTLQEDSREMKAMVAYIRWVGSGVKKGENPKGVGLVELPYLDRPANAKQGKVLYAEKCVVCHGASGEGMLNTQGTGWLNPPVWGEKSYNHGADLFRLSRFAGYIKANMPFGATYETPLLSDEESWDIAAYVNSLSRPTKDLTGDWPDISKKPVDHPFADEFSEEQHKFGPFKPILEKQKQTTAQVVMKK